MSKPSYIGANVELNADTFASFIDKVNFIIDDMGKTVVTVASVNEANSVNGSVTTGNAHIEGILSAKIAVAQELRGGDFPNPASIILSSNIVPKANTVTSLGTTGNRLTEVFTSNANSIDLVTNTAVVNVATITTATVTTGNVATLTSNNATVTNANIRTLASNNATMNVAVVTTGNVVTLTSNTTTINVATINSANVNTLVANNATVTNANITTANVATGNVATLTSNNATVTNANIRTLASNAATVNVATITTLTATTGNVATLTSNNTTVTNANIRTLASNNATMNVATVTTLSATTGNVVTLTSNSVTSNVASVTTLTATTGNVASLTSNNATVANAVITTASVTTANVVTLTSNSVTTNVASAVTGTITTFTSNNATMNVATITNATVTNANVGSFTATTASVGNITSSGDATVSGNSDLQTTVIHGNLTVEGETFLASNNALTLNTSAITHLTVLSTAALDGNTTIGNATTDIVTFTARLNSDLVPSTTNTRDLGTTSLRFSDIWLSGNVNAKTLNINPTGAAASASIGRVDGTASTTNFDFRSGANTAISYDTRLSATGGTNANGGGTLNIQNTNLQHNGNRILTIADEGAGNGLDADLLDGQQGSYYLDAANLTGTIADARLPTTLAAKTFTTQMYIDGATSAHVWFRKAGVNRGIVFTDDTNDRFIFRKYSTTGVSEGELALWGLGATDLKHNGNTVWTAANDGAGSTLDADLLDGQQGSYYLSAANLTGTLADARLPTTQAGKTFTSAVTMQSMLNVATNGSSGGIEIGRTDGTASTPFIDFHTTATAVDYNVRLLASGGTTTGNGTLDIITGTDQLLSNGNKIWHAGNDGAGSTLDADLLDGQQGSYYLNAANLTGTLADARLPTTMAGKTFNSAVNITGNLTGTGNVDFARFYGTNADTAAAPSFTNASDLNTGIWFPAADQIGFTTGGTNRITISSSGIAGAGGGLTGLNGSNISTGTVADARLPTTMAGKTFSGTLSFSGPDVIASTTTAGETRIYGGTVGGANGARLWLFGSTHATNANQSYLDATNIYFRGANGLGTPTVQIGGNTVWHAGNDGSGSGLDADLLDGQDSAFYRNGSNINAGTVAEARLPATTSQRTYPRRSDGGSINFIWSGQSGQPTWLWGGTDGTNMYVYNPSNFNVNYANGAGYAAGADNADTVDGLHASAFAQVYYGTGNGETNFPIGHIIAARLNAGGWSERNASRALNLVSGTAIEYCSSNSGLAGNALSGTWRCRGITQVDPQSVQLFQRTA